MTGVVESFCETQATLLASGISKPSDWAPTERFVAVDDFRRVGAYLEEFDWPTYLEFLTAWASGGTRFEMTVLRVIEAANVVVQQIEERHHRGGEFIRKNVVAVYVFDDDGKIRHLDIYEQATDSGRWIRDAAATGGLAS